MKAVLDTSVVIGDRWDMLMADEIAVSIVTVAELQFGVLCARDEASRAARLRVLGDLQRTLDALPVDQAVASCYAELAAAVRTVGRRPRPRSLDLLIAATAYAHDAALYTRNPSDLVGLETLVDIRTPYG